MHALLWSFFAEPAALAAEPEAAPAPAPAAPEEEDAAAKVSVSFTEDLEIRYQRFDPAPLLQVGGPPPKFIEEVNRFTGRAQSGPWSFSAQIDQVAFIGLPYLVDGERVSTPPNLITQCTSPPCVFNPLGDYVYLNPEKVALRYEKPHFQLTLGDFYAAFGYGAALNLNRNVDIDVDSSVQGARVAVKSGDWDVQALAGTLNRQQVFADNPNFGTLQGDYRHLIAGARVVRSDVGPMAIGLHGVGYDFTSEYGFEGALNQALTPLDAVIGGGTVEIFGLGGIDWQLEGDISAFPLDEDGENLLFPEEDPKLGHSLYAAAQFYTGAVAWQVDAKHYEHFQRINRPLASEQYQAIVPPTLEYDRAVNYNTASALTSDDIYGARLRADIALGSVTPYVSVAASRDEDLANASQHAPAPETIVVGQVGVEALLDDASLLVNVAGRSEMRDGDNGADRQVYGDFDLEVPLFAGTHGSFIVFGQWFDPGPESAEFGEGDPAPWTETSFSATLSPAATYGITGYFDYTTNPFAQAGGNLWSPYTFGAAEVYFKPGRAWTIRAFHGGYAAGIRCSGGQCRTVPAFTGTRLAVTGAF